MNSIYLMRWCNRRVAYIDFTLTIAEQLSHWSLSSYITTDGSLYYAPASSSIRTFSSSPLNLAKTDALSP